MIRSSGMPIDLATGQLDPARVTVDRRERRVELPDCPSCRLPLQVDVRSSDTLYARCQWCGHRRMVPKPTPMPLEP